MMSQINKPMPKDVQVMTKILNDMGISDFEPRIINQMLEFSYRYISEVLEDAKLYSTHGGKRIIDVDDVKLAIKMKLDNSYVNPPPRELLLELAQHKNSTPLPLIKPFTGPKLPPDRYCLINPNYQVLSSKKTNTFNHSLTTSCNKQNVPIKGVIGQSPQISMMQNSLAPPSLTTPPFRFVSRSQVEGTNAYNLNGNILKRKRDEDDDDYDI